MRVLIGGDESKKLEETESSSAFMADDQTPITTTTTVINHGEEEEEESDDDDDDAAVINLYPLNCFYFGSKDPLQSRNETPSQRLHRLKSNYDARGLRACVEAVILVELLKHPHVLLLQVRNSFFKLPGGRLRLGESDLEGLRRKLSRKLCAVGDSTPMQWEVGECLGKWWRMDFETLLYPYLPPSIKKPKECIKLFLVKLRAQQKFVVPKNMKLLAVPLSAIHENHKTYGTVIAGIPQLLSKFSFNMVEI